MASQRDNPDSRSIQERINAAKPGETIRVAPGVYRERLTLKEGIHLLGEDPETCQIRWDVPDESILVAKDIRSGSVTGLSFSGLGKATGAALKNTSLRVDRCYFMDTALFGLWAIGSLARPTVVNCLFNGSADCGIVFADGAKGEARGNSIHNSMTGILCINSGTKAALTENICSGNEELGISFSKGASGEAVENKCSSNMTGIGVFGEGTAPKIIRNKCVDNQTSGIGYFEGARGISRGNYCGNNEYGIVVVGQGTSPRLLKNICENNYQSGIAFLDGSSGVACGNTCKDNWIQGIAQSTDSSPKLRRNRLNDPEVDEIDDGDWLGYFLWRSVKTFGCIVFIGAFLLLALLAGLLGGIVGFIGL